jgi:small subunit ribosomal protein S1
MGDALHIGARLKGTISSITDYGLFVEVEKGIEGLVHISEISWTDRINNLADKFKVGQVINVLVVSLDKENRRMSLSIKQLDKNPWDSIDEQFKVGQKITGTISNITDFGIFVQLVPGIDGLVHISDLSWTEHIAHPGDVYKRGDKVEAVILGIDKDNKKVSLGIKQLQQDPWDRLDQEYPVGKIIEGEVSKITNFGAFVKLPTGIEGLVHISELSDQNVEKVDDILKIGEKRQFRVLNVNKEERKLGLSLKLEASPKRERTDRSESRSPRTERSEAPRKEKSAATTTASTAPKTKSLFQLELEKHAAKSQDNSNDTESDK